MTLDELKRAEAERKDLHAYQDWASASKFGDMEVVGVILRRKATPQGCLTRLIAGECSLWDYNFSDALGKKLTEQFQAWFQSHILDRKKALRELGIKGEEVDD